MGKAKITSKKRSSRPKPEADSTYFLKLLLYVLVGSLWLRIQSDTLHLALPIGLVIGLLFAAHEHFRIDRKIEYAVMLVAMFVGYIASSYGFYVTL